MIGRTQAKGYALANLTFTDSAQIPTYAAYYIRAMVGQGVINGYSDGQLQAPQQHYPRSDGQDPLQPDVTAHRKRPRPF